MANKKKNASSVKKSSEETPEPVKSKSSNVTKGETLKDLKIIYSVNGKFDAQLTRRQALGWFCAVWATNSDGSRRPRIRNVQPFATLEEAIQMARSCFANFTGDDRYIAQDDVWKGNKPD